ncbi:hypothetical protein ABE493_07685 [Stenotrophomonas terrae]|uniref:hypothetical protein n=1 Tax=Stenotrophomonas terrae TaxID=405446 RepID=UPI00320957E2
MSRSTDSGNDLAIAREHALNIARIAAFAHCSDHTYLPQSREIVDTWLPHEWVLTAIEVAGSGKPAAAQEAVCQPDGYHYRYPTLYGTGTYIRKNNGEEVNGSKPVEAVPYWYAPVAAAPVDGGQVTGWRNVDGIAVFTVASHSGIIPDQEFVRYDDHLAALASTPAAPGIDHAGAALAHLSNVLDDLQYSPDQRPVPLIREAMWHVQQMQARIDASPNSGSEAVQIADTDGVREILGRMCFQCIRLAEVLRLRGDEIGRRAEDEQAAVLRFLLNHYLAAPEKWAEHAQAEIDAIRKQATSDGAGVSNG